MSVDDATISRIAVEIAKAQVRSDTPRYRQIIDVLLATIEHGLLAPGDRLPPETKLASLFSVSLGTAQKALTHLASSGILQRVRRKGTIVDGRQAEDVFVFRFKEVGTGKVLIPFTRVLSTPRVAAKPARRPVAALNTARCAMFGPGVSSIITQVRTKARALQRICRTSGNFGTFPEGPTIAGEAARRRLAFECLEKIDKITNLPGVETEFWHVGMSRDDSFCQCPGETLDRVSEAALTPCR